MLWNFLFFGGVFSVEEYVLGCMCDLFRLWVGIKVRKWFL